MADNQTAHLTVSYKDAVQGAEITYIFAVSEEISHELVRQMPKLAGNDLVAWLDGKGCKLDCPDGPAQVRREADGSSSDVYYRDGELHREDGPALVRREADGSTYEYCYKDGKLVEPFAPPSVIGGVTVRRIAPKAPGKQRPPASA
jgi:hypothetical protein